MRKMGDRLAVKDDRGWRGLGASTRGIRTKYRVKKVVFWTSFIPDLVTN